MQGTTKPLLVFGTRHGTIYNLTPNHLPQLPGIQLSVGDFYDHRETLKSLPEGMSLKKFLGFPEQIVTYLSPYDFYKKEGMTGCEKNTTVKIKCSKGYTPFTASEYDLTAKILKPDYMVTLTEYPASQKGHANESNKSHKRAISKTTTYLQNSVVAKQPRETTKLLAAIHGGRNLSLLGRSLEQALEHDVDGLVLCDMCEGEEVQEREEVFRAMLERIKESEKKDLILGLAGMGRIPDIEHAMGFGFTLFEVNYPFQLAEEQKALIKTDMEWQEHTPVLSRQLKPLDPKCKCYACTRHNESYIAHLIACFELNAKILLSIHNVAQYTDFLNSFE